MTRYKQGDVVLLPFPFTDLTTTKQRPALIISNHTFNIGGTDIVACAITSQSPQILSGFEIFIPPLETKRAGLPKPSKVRCGKIVTLHFDLIQKNLGEFSPQFMNKIIELFLSVFQ